MLLSSAPAGRPVRGRTIGADRIDDQVPDAGEVAGAPIDPDTTVWLTV